jgi:deoxycytidine triphosphate deaminase
MNTRTGDEIAEHLEGIVHDDTQRQPHGYDLTVAKIFAFSEAGSLDFGGGEYEAAELRELEALERDPDDDYGWWDLPDGRYLARLNESLADEFPLTLEPHPRLLRAGATHATLTWTDADGPIDVLIDVGEVGVHIKENARISVAR